MTEPMIDPRLVEPDRRINVESIPWHYGVKDRYNGDIRGFGEDLEGALNYASPVGEYPQLTILRWRQGPEELAVIADDNA